MTFSNSLPLVEDVPATFWLHCSYCGRAARNAETKTDAVLLALKHGWKIRLNFFSTETEFVGLSDLIEAVDLFDTLCPSCLKREFE